MHRMQSISREMILACLFIALTGLWWPARGDLIRPKSSRTYPDIAGDLVGSQTYTFDPTSRTGTFHVTNAPQFIALGPAGQDMINVTPAADGTLTQTLQLKLDQDGRLVDNPDNRFQLFGTVTIGSQVYRGLLLEGKPTSFGAQVQAGASLPSADVFDLDLKITGGQLAQKFGPEGYFRIMPQSNSTFQGSFGADFSGDKPLTNLRALQGNLPAPIPEPTTIIVFLTGTAGVLARRFCRRPMNRASSPRGSSTTVLRPASSRFGSH